MKTQNQISNLTKIPALSPKADLNEIALYLHWLQKSDYLYHFDDDPEDIESFTDEEKKILRSNANIMWNRAAQLTDNASNFIWDGAFKLAKKLTKK